MSFTKVAPAGIGTEPGNSILIGDSLLHSTGIDLGHNTGIGVTIRKHGDATFTGIVTAASFSGSGANLTGIDATAIKHTDGNVKVQAINTGANLTGNLSVSGNLGVGGVLTYEDVTNVDSIGIITARSGIQIGAGGTIGSSGGGIVTYFGDGGQLINISSVGGATGVDFNDNVKIRLGTGNDLEIYHNGVSNILGTSNGNIELVAGSEYMAKFIPNGAVELYNDGVKKAETFGSGLKVSGGGELYIDGNAASGHCQLIMTRSDVSYMMANETFLRFYTQSGNQSSPSNLIAEFTNSGHFRPGADNTYDLGDNTRRWRNLYTTDLKLSNEGSQNDVDGTWGNYTIQEGESDLFLINNRNGKKYKFNLTEVS